jgi:glutamate decarboxylase
LEDNLHAVLFIMRKWQNDCAAASKPLDKLNIVMSPVIQAGWEKAAELLEIEERDMMNPKNIINLVDENTIGVCILHGTKYA